MGSGLLGGDFNAIKHYSERKGRSLYDNDNELNLFANFMISLTKERNSLGIVMTGSLSVALTSSSSRIQ